MSVAVTDPGPRITLRNSFMAPYDDAMAAARTCTSHRVIAADEITDRQRHSIGSLTFAAGHHTVYQHATFEFAIEGVSRQLVWSFLHSFPFYNSEQQSQRYVRQDEIAAHLPELEPAARRIYEAAIVAAWRAYERLSAILEEPCYETLCRVWRRSPDPGKSPLRKRALRQEAGKRAIETARYVLPVACHTALVYTISGLTLHRLRLMMSCSDVPAETRRLVPMMVQAVDAVDPKFFGLVGAPPLGDDDLPEARAVEAALADAGSDGGAPDPRSRRAFRHEFDTSLEGRVSKLVSYQAGAEEIVAGAVRHVLGLPRAALGDDAALAMVLDPARDRLRLETLNVGVHSPLLRTLQHPSYTFRKRLSHSADSQDQRHRMVPASRPALRLTGDDEPDFVTPHLITAVPAARAIYVECMERAWEAQARLRRLGASEEHVLYLLPNAAAVRFEESGSLLHLLHKWTMRTCLNAQWEIYEASMQEIEQVRAVHPRLVRHVGPPCVLRRDLVRPFCTEGKRYCGVPVWKTWPDVARQI